MVKIPITPGKLTGDILEAYHRGYLDNSDLTAWAEALITAGYDSDAIIEALGNDNLHWQEIPSLFNAICRDVGLSQNISADIDTLKKQAMIEEYRHGYRQGAELFQRFDELRKNAGYPEAIHLRLIEDNADGTNDSGYYSDQSRQHGSGLEAQVCTALESIGISRLKRDETK